MDTAALSLHRAGPRRIGRRAVLALCAALIPRPADTAPPALETIRLPPGFRITTYAYPVPGARSLALSPNGTLFVGSRAEGRVYAVVRRNGDGRGDPVIIVARGLDQPNGVAFRDGALYVAEVGRILRYDDIEQRLRDPPRPVVIYDRLPRERAHGWRYLRFGPDGYLYVAIGAPCNVCEAPGHGLIARLRPDGSGWEIYARGIRNCVGFDWAPGTGVLWFTDNGRDWLGDDRPPDELNRAPRPGLDFGFPYCHGGVLPDPEFGRRRGCVGFMPPAQALGAHVAALGMRFYTGTRFPARYRGQVFIAEHGSWNRRRKSGYRITVVRHAGARVTGYAPFATGWLQGQKAWGRPVDVAVTADGALLVSDDLAGAVYRIDYRTPPVPRNATGGATIPAPVLQRGEPHLAP